MKRILKAILTTAGLGAALASPEAEFTVPVIGYVHDTTAAQVRPLTGTPGAATAGTGAAIGEAEIAAVAHDGTFAIVSGQGILRFTESGIETVEVADVPPAFDKAALSTTAASALLYSRECQCVRVVEDLRGTPKLARTIPLPESAEARALAVDDTARVVAIALADGKVLIHGVAEVSLAATALTIDKTGDRLLAVDADARALYIVSSLAEGPVVTQLRAEVSSPVAAAFGANSTVLIADADKGVIVYHQGDGTSSAVECLCRPSTIERANTAGMYRLSALEQGSVWMLDLSAESPRTFFVPVRREAAE